MRIISPTNPNGEWDLMNGNTVPMIGKVKVTQGIRPGVISFALGFGHFAYGGVQELLAITEAQHKHLCPRQVLGVRMGMYAADLLGIDLPQGDKRVLTFVETDGGFADEVTAATGCTLGHRTLRHVDHGKTAAVFVDTKTELPFEFTLHQNHVNSLSAASPTRKAAGMLN